MFMIKHSQSIQSYKFTMPLHYLKKEVRDGVQFLHEGKHQSFYKLVLVFLMEVARHVQSTQNRKLLILKYLKKKSIATAFVFYCDAKDSLVFDMKLQNLFSWKFLVSNFPKVFQRAESLPQFLIMMLCWIRYHLDNLKNVETSMEEC